MSNDSTSGSPPTGYGEFPGADGEFDLDEALDVLSHAYRRHGLSYLVADDGWVPLDDLYGHVASAVDRAGERTDVSRRVEVAFHHWHRPALEDAALIEYDEENGTVRATESAADLERFLELTA